MYLLAWRDDLAAQLLDLLPHRRRLSGPTILTGLLAPSIAVGLGRTRCATFAVDDDHVQSLTVAKEKD